MTMRSNSYINELTFSKFVDFQREKPLVTRFNLNSIHVYKWMYMFGKIRAKF